MNEAAGIIQQVKPLLGELATLRFSALTTENLGSMLAEAEELGRFADTIRVLAAAEVAERSRPDLGDEGMARKLGHAKPAYLIEHIARVSESEAYRRMRLGALIAPQGEFMGHERPAKFPGVAAAMVAGEMDVEAAMSVVTNLTQAARHGLPEQLTAAEEDLVHAARYQSATLVKDRAIAWRTRIDQDGARPRDERQRESRSCTAGKELDTGMTMFTLVCDPLNAALIKTAFSERTGPKVQPRFMSPEDIESGTETTTTPDGDVITMVRDTRSHQQRRFDILMGLLTAGLRNDRTETGTLRSTTQVIATIKLEDLKSGRGIGWLDGVTEPISAAHLQEITCGNGYRLAIQGDEGEILYFGQLKRYFTEKQKLAMALRDGGCAWPECNAPPGATDAHHIHEHGEGGPTDIDNGCLLCVPHHQMLHNSEFTIKMIKGKPHLLAPPWLDPDQVWKPLGKARV